MNKKRLRIAHFLKWSRMNNRNRNFFIESLNKDLESHFGDISSQYHSRIISDWLASVVL